jgi:predicted metal-dependent hydrolase
MRLFNAGQFFEAHEAWEILWLAEGPGASRRGLQGLIQLAAAFHKLLVQGHVRGAGKLLDRALAKLEGLPADHLGVAMGPLRDGARHCLAAVRDLEQRGLGAECFDRMRVPRLERS